MGLFGSSEEKQDAEKQNAGTQEAGARASESMGAAAAGASAEDGSFLDEDAGQGFEGMDQSVMGTPFLQLTQSNSEVVEAGTHEPGHFVNSITKEDYGTKILAIVCKFAMAWVERDDAGKSVARYDLGGIEVTGDNYTGMRNPKSGNKVVETWYYQLLLPEHPEAGFVIFSSTPGNMKYLKGLNTQMRFLRLPSGAPAPMYAGVWELSINPDVSKKGKKYFSFKGGIRLAGWIPQVLYKEVVLPIKNAAFMLPAPADVDRDAVAEDVEDADNRKY